MKLIFCITNTINKKLNSKRPFLVVLNIVLKKSIQFNSNSLLSASHCTKDSEYKKMILSLGSL